MSPMTSSSETDMLRETITRELEDWAMYPLLATMPAYLAPIAADAGVDLRLLKHTNRTLRDLDRRGQGGGAGADALASTMARQIRRLIEQVENASRVQVARYAGLGPSSADSRRSRSSRRSGNAVRLTPRALVKPWPAEEARRLRSIARHYLAADRHYSLSPHIPGSGHGSKPDPDNCEACAIRTGGREGPNVAGWARLFVEAQRPVPKKWREAFQRELDSDNRAYANALQRSIVTFGEPRFV